MFFPRFVNSFRFSKKQNFNRALTLGAFCFEFLYIIDLTQTFKLYMGISEFHVTPCWLDKTLQEARSGALVASNTQR